MMYLNKGLSILVNSHIVEYDIKSGNTSIMAHNSLCSQEELLKLNSLSKDKRNVEVGLMQRNKKEFAKALEGGFNKAVDEFLKMNNLSLDTDVISVKRDAVFVINKEIQQNTIGDFIHFIPKNEYLGYLHCPPYEFYVKKDSVDVKGLNDKLVELHKDGIIALIQDIVDVCATNNMNQKAINLYFKNIVSLYKNRLLPFDIYRQFDSTSKFLIQVAGRTMLMDSISESLIDKTIIDFNFIKILLPTIRNIC